MADAPLDAFILYNVKEPRALMREIVARLNEEGIQTHFDVQDIKPGDRWEEIQESAWDRAQTIVAFLGDAGWGPIQRQLAERAISENRRIIPVLIGSPTDDDFTKARRLFLDRQRINLVDLNPEGMALLIQTLRQPETHGTADLDSGRFDEIIQVFVDGNEEDRAEALRRVRELPVGTQASLAEVLRQQISQRFSPESEKGFAESVRDPKRISSIRSWMLSALIWVDAESKPSYDILLRHLDTAYETDQNVRFWVLAGLYQKKASFVATAAHPAQLDHAGEVAWLARVILGGSDATVIDSMKGMLANASFAVAWIPLRVLRIVPIPELAQAVCKLLGAVISGVEITYDAVYALCLPEMARAALPILQKEPGIPRVAQIVASTARDASPNTVRNFASFLKELPQAEVAEGLREAAKDRQNRRVVGLIQDALHAMASGQTRSYFIADYASDTIDVKSDHLDIKQDVKVLTAVILAKNVTPPLAVGLFGPWGSGKSFFMKAIQEEARELAAAATQDPQPRFCSDIVLIEFNAWHYSDTSLLASLVSHIYEELDEYVDPKKTDAEKQAELEKELTETKATADIAEEEKKQAEAQLSAQNAELERLKKEREEKEVTLQDLRATDVAKLIESNPELERKIKEAVKAMGLPDVVAASSNLTAVLDEAKTVRGRAMNLFVELVQGKNSTLTWVLVGALLIIPPLVALIFPYIDQFAAKVSVVVAPVAAFITGLAAAIRKALEAVSKNLVVVESAKKKVDELIANKKAQETEEEKRLSQEIKALEEQRDAANQKILEAKENSEKLEAQIKALEEAGSLRSFLKEKRQSEDYKKHLGLISVIRRDFEALRDRMAKVSFAGKKVDRIVLFIDDLDRCHVDKVVEVLQAVHLLLAYPLFVVVVGVDPRWLLHSLEKNYSAFQQSKANGEEDSEVWRTTPQNYLEKIFQIPFNLKPMQSGGYRRLVDKLFVPSRMDEAAVAHVASSSSKVAASQEQPAANDKPTDKKRRSKKTESTEIPAPAQPTMHEPTPQPEFVIQEQALAIRGWESDFAGRLFELIPNPRAAKRFTNIYRILKAPLSRADLIGFEGTEGLPGSFQTPMLLLALLIGHPDDAADIFPKLYAAQTDDEIWEVLKNAKNEDLGRRLLSILDEPGFHVSAGTFRYWLPKVSRFSFEVGHILPYEDSNILPQPFAR